MKAHLSHHSEIHMPRYQVDREVQRSGKWTGRKLERWLIHPVWEIILPKEKSGLCPKRSSLSPLNVLPTKSIFLCLEALDTQIGYANEVIYGGGFGPPHQLNLWRS